MDLTTHAIAPLLRRLAHFAALAQTDIVALSRAVFHVRSVRAGEDIVVQGDHPDHVNIVIRGYVARCKTLLDGRRQITSLYLDGDLFDLRMFVLDRMDHSLVALTPAEVAYIPRERLLALTDEHPRIARAFWSATLVNESIIAEWVVNVGRRTAPERFAHLVCELYWRLKAAGAATDGVLSFPFTQSTVSDMLALSPVHTNRSISSLRREGLIRWKHRMLEIADLPALERLAGFDPAYLHLTSGRDTRADDGGGGRTTVAIQSR